jgi:hypothetical protein
VNKRLSSLNKRHSTTAIPAEIYAHGRKVFVCQKRISVLFITVSLFILHTVSAQNIAKGDSVSIPKHSAKKATYYSMVLPGLGQAYNKKYWKIPVIYAGFGTLAYFIHTNNQEYLKFKEAYEWNISGDTTPIDNPLTVKYKDPADLLTGMNYYRRNLEVSVMFTAVLYILNVVDAAVDAHFFDFNVSDDLSLHVQPYLNPSPFASKQSGGLRLTFSF